MGWAMVKRCFPEIVTDIADISPYCYRVRTHSKIFENIGFHTLPANALAEQEPFQALFGIGLAKVDEDQKADQRVEREFHTRILQDVTLIKV